MINPSLSYALEKMQEKMLSSYKQSELIKAFETISSRYRSGSGLFLQTEQERLVYLLTRLPGTFSAVRTVLEEMQKRSPYVVPKTLLDVGAGPGTGMWAASQVFSSLEKCTLLERDERFMKIGKEMALHASEALIQKANWLLADLQNPLSISCHDIVLLSYSIGEVEEKFWVSQLTTLFENTGRALIIIEPGTPSGYRRLMKIRDILLALKGHLWAPCPHSFSCPLKLDDWCHFSVRVPRSSIHRQLKSADLGYEDEKFSYLIFGKDPLMIPFSARVIRHPIKHQGHVEVTFCQKEGIERKVFSKKDKDTYKKMKKIEWGESS
jgi:ribosomal protein RSM22 (predicted rRNA methylase)